MLLHSLFNQSLNIIIISHFHKAYNNHDDENDVLKSNESTQILKKKEREKIALIPLIFVVFLL